MTHDELLAKIDILERDSESDIWLIHNDRCCGNCICDKAEAEATSPHKALRAVVELSKPYLAGEVYVNPEFNQGVMAAFRLVIDAIEKELK
jgi:hypothetical protein